MADVSTVTVNTSDPISLALSGGEGDEQKAIAALGLEIVTEVLTKNRRYGSAATNPIRVFSKLDSEAGIRLRLDDKLRRIQTGAADDDEDPYRDLIGYLLLLMVARRGADG